MPKLVMVLTIILAARASAAEVNRHAQAALERLGYELFFDPILSLKRDQSCASCHNPAPDMGWSDGRPRAVGAASQAQIAAALKDGTRVGIMNVRRTRSLYDCAELIDLPSDADGRANGIKDSCLQAVADPTVMGFPTIGDAVARLNANSHYRELAREGFGDDKPYSEERLRDAILAFLATIRSGPTLADRIAQGLTSDVPPTILRGWTVFKRDCAVCHDPDRGWRDHEYHNVGLATMARNADRLRGAITKKAGDNFQALTPNLRNVARHPPYGHDGYLKTIEDAVAFFSQGGRYTILPDPLVLADPTRDELIKNIRQSREEYLDCLAFVEIALQSEQPPTREDPHK
jgi:cytochrome c peroxidase